MKRILVVGGAGYLGSVLCRKLLERGYKVRVLDCLMYGDNGIKNIYSHKNFEFHLGDIRNIADLMRATKNVNTIIHLGAIVGDSASDLNPEETVEINYLSTKILAWVCKYHRIKRLIFASTCSIYGDSGLKGILTEESNINPLSLYSKMKLKSENGLLTMINDFSPCILRMGTLYGLSNRNRFDLVINWFGINAIKNKKITLFGGNQKRAFCHIEDAADAYITCLEAPIEEIHGEIFNVASRNMTIAELGSHISNMVEGTELIINEKEIDERSYMVSSDKLRQLGWNPKRDIKYFIDNIKKQNCDDYKNPIYNNYEYLKQRGMRKI